MNAMNAMTKQKTETEKTKNRNRNRRGDAAHYYEELEELQLESVAAAGLERGWTDPDDPALRLGRVSVKWYALLKYIDPNYDWSEFLTWLSEPATSSVDL